MYRHNIELEGSEWFVIGNGDSETCNPDSVRSITCDWLYTGQKIFVSEEDCSNLPTQGRFETSWLNVIVSSYNKNRYRTEKKLATRLCVPFVDVSLRASFYSASHFSR